MNYIKLLSVIFCILSFLLDSPAQTTIKYTYDSSGNRTEKALWIGGQKKSEQVADESIKNEKEDIVEEMLEETKISLFPNPTEGSLRVNFENLPDDLQSTLSVFDMNGKAILNKRHLSNTNQIDLTHQPSGTYIMIITIGENTTRWKVMKR